MPGGIIDVQAVQTRVRDRVEEEHPSITLSARVAVSASSDFRVTARPLVGSIADCFDEPRLEVHAEGGTSVILSGLPLPALLEDALAFLRDAKAGSSRGHDFTFGLRAQFDLSTAPFATLEQPPFEVASAQTLVHESGSVVLRLLGAPRRRRREEFHTPARSEEEDVRPAFELQLAARKGRWLRDELESVLPELRSAEASAEGDAAAGVDA